MTEVKLRLFATLTYKNVCAGLLALILIVSNGFDAANAKADEVQFATPEVATEQGIAAYRGGYYEIAVPALEYAAAHNVFIARYYLAKLLSDNSGPRTDHARAYDLYEKIANEFAESDPHDRSRAPYVADSIVRLAKYILHGIEEIELRPKPKVSYKLLRHAAFLFQSENAHFELAKMNISGTGVRANVPEGLHGLAKLSRLGHPGAQAFLANIYWQGKLVKRNTVEALALISLAVKNADDEDRVWIEDIYQNIYCGAGIGVRKDVDGMVAEWDKRYGRRRIGSGSRTPDGRSDFTALEARPLRTCANGEILPQHNPRIPPASTDQVADGGAEYNALPDRERRILRGGAAGGVGFGVRSIGSDANGNPVR